MIKRVIVAIGSEPYEKNAFDYAGHLAVFLESHLSCAYFQDELKDDYKEAIQELLDQTRRDCDEFGLNYDVELVIGKPTETILQKVRAADLFVVGISESIKTQGLKLVYDQIDDILLRITKPTIVVHENCTLLRKILIAHRGDHHSDRALELAAEFGERTHASLLCFAMAETQMEVARITQDMQDYLQYHDVKASFMTKLGDTVAHVLETAEKEDCDLIALGASPHGRFYEMIFQSTTESVVKLANRAVLVCR